MQFWTHKIELIRCFIVKREETAERFKENENYTGEMPIYTVCTEANLNDIFHWPLT